MKKENPKKSGKKALGRGLSALFDNDSSPPPSSPPQGRASQPPTEPSPATTMEIGYYELPIKSIHANPNQPRNHFDQDRLEELATSIKNFGIIEPILVNPKTSQTDKVIYEVIAGERRLRAARLAGLEKVPVIIKNQDNEDLLETMLIENLQREDLTPMEEAQSYEAIISKKNLTQDQLGEMLGKSRSHITNMIRMLKAPLAIKQKLAENRLSSSQARTLMTLPEREMVELADRAEKEDLSVRDLEKIVKSFHQHGSSSPAKPHSGKTDPHITELETQYRDRLKTKVVIHPLKNKKGKVEIEYYNYDELLGILDKIKE